jgi:predicted nucleic-acid-binding Zn-ribbon protein
MNTPHRCKCGKFARREDCPKCRAAQAREDKIVAFLIGDVVRVRQAAKVPVDLGMCWSGQ